MFDIYRTEEAARYPQTITENRAPTDDSIRLYGEFLNKARAEIIDSLSPSNSLLDLTVTLRARLDTLGSEFIVSFKLNGEKFVFTHSISEVKLICSDQWELEKEIRNHFAKSIGEAILSKTVFPRGMGR